MATHLDASPGVRGSVKRRVLALAALVVVLATLGFIAWKHQEEVAAHRTQAQARLDALTEQQTHITDIEAQYATLDDAYKAAENEAYAAMETRHNSTDDDVEKAQAKKELTNVNVMQGILPTRQSSLDEISDAYANALGEGAVTAFRTGTDQVMQTEGLGLNRWWRAINDISDSLTNGSLESENINQLYDESSDYDTRAATQAKELERQWTGLQRQLQDRIDGAKRDLAAIR